MRVNPNGPEIPKQPLTSREIAAWLRVSSETVHRLRRRGLLPARRVGGQWRFFASEVLDALPASGKSVIAPMNPRRNTLEAVLRSLESR